MYVFERKKVAVCVFTIQYYRKTKCSDMYFSTRKDKSSSTVGTKNTMSSSSLLGIRRLTVPLSTRNNKSSSKYVQRRLRVLLLIKYKDD